MTVEKRVVQRHITQCVKNVEPLNTVRDGSHVVQHLENTLLVCGENQHITQHVEYIGTLHGVWR